MLRIVTAGRARAAAWWACLAWMRPPDRCCRLAERGFPLRTIRDLFFLCPLRLWGCHFYLVAWRAGLGRETFVANHAAERARGLLSRVGRAVRFVSLSSLDTKSFCADCCGVDEGGSARVVARVIRDSSGPRPLVGLQCFVWFMPISGPSVFRLVRAH